VIQQQRAVQFRFGVFLLPAEHEFGNFPAQQIDPTVTERTNPLWQVNDFDACCGKPTARLLPDFASDLNDCQTRFAAVHAERRCYLPFGFNVRSRVNGFHCRLDIHQLQPEGQPVGKRQSFVADD
jgi:hypothetical protein